MPDACLKVLVVDDEPLLLMAASDLVDELGHRAIAAASAIAALDVANSDPTIDLLITDETMPGKLGSELAMLIQQFRPGLPVIIATGHQSLPASAEQNWVLLRKPFGLQELSNAIDGAIAFA